jgi:hypothetical protein
MAFIAPRSREFSRAFASALVWEAIGPQSQFDESMLAGLTAQIAAMPDYLRAGISTFRELFLIAAWVSTGTSFGKQSLESRAKLIGRWRRAPVGAMRDFIRLHESLTLFSYFSKAAEIR